MVDDLLKIEKFINRYHKPEDPIPSKSKSRVLRTLAQSIRHNKGLPEKIPCNLCYDSSGKLIPVTMRVCSGCIKHFIKKAGNPRWMKSEWGDFYCDYCLGRGYKIHHINPYVCRKCASRIGYKHRVKMPKIKIAAQRVMDKRILQQRF